MKTLHQRGFTFTEVAITAAAASALVLLFGFLLTKTQETGRTRLCQNNIRQLLQAVENYEADWLVTPQQLADLYPAYLPKIQSFFCPDDRARAEIEDQTAAFRRSDAGYDATSYSPTYISRSLNGEARDALVLCCIRHYRNTRTVAGYLSFAVDVSNAQPVIWKPSGGTSVPAEYGQNYSGTGGRLTFTDGTVINIIGGTVGLHSSFQGSDATIHSVVCLDDPEDGAPDNEIEVNHPGPQPFEIVTPLFIASPQAGAVCSVRVQSPGADMTAENRLSVLTPPTSSARVRTRSRDLNRTVSLAAGSPPYVETTTWTAETWDLWKRNWKPKYTPRRHPHRNR